MTGPVSYPVNVGHLSPKGLPVWLEADEAQRAALAGIHGLAAVERFRFDLTLTPWQGRAVRVSGRVEADIVQNCVVTLEPVPAQIAAQVDALFVPEGSRLLRPESFDSGELILDAEGPDMPETFSGDSIDAGAVAEEFFTLSIDPYPRKPGALLPTGQGEDEEGARGPLYEQLKALKRGR